MYCLSTIKCTRSNWPPSKKDRKQGNLDVQFIAQFMQKGMHEGGSTLGELITCLCGHCIAELEQLAIEMVQHVGAVVGRVLFSKGIRGVIGAGLSVTAKSARNGPANDARCSETIKAISIAHDTRLQGARLDIAAETVGIDGV